MSERSTSRMQLLIGLVVLVLAVFTVAQSILYRAEDKAIQTCFHESFEDLSTTLGLRGDLQEREAVVIRHIFDTYADAAGLRREDPTEELTPRQQDRLRRALVDALLAYRAESQAIQRERKENPVPPYPSGKCDNG